MPVALTSAVWGLCVFVPAGTRHNFVNTGEGDLRLYTVYAPPQHAHGTIHRTRAEADADEADVPERARELMTQGGSTR